MSELTPEAKDVVSGRSATVDGSLSEPDQVLHLGLTLACAGTGEWERWDEHINDAARRLGRVDHGAQRTGRSRRSRSSAGVVK